MRPIVGGTGVDQQTRCAHWSSEVDVVAIRFCCCGAFYACHTCHQEAADHPAEVWPRDRFDEQAILCGVCGSTLSIADYLTVTACPSCAAPFNPRCALHAHLYFEVRTS